MTAPRWILGLCSVLFDVDVGPKVENLVPENALTPEEKQDVAFHAFPDSMSMELHARTTIRDSCFFFRVKRRGSQPAAAAGAGAVAVEQGLNGPASDKYLYGFVFCRQRQDASLQRGGEQLSVLVLSEHPFSSVLRPLSQAAGQMFFSHGKSALAQLHREVSAWPAPVAGPLLQLQAGHTNIQARLPSMHTLPHPSSLVEMCSRAPSIDPTHQSQQLDGIIDAALADGAGPASSAPGAGAAQGVGRVSISDSRHGANAYRPPRSLVRSGSLPTRPRGSTANFASVKSVPLNLGTRPSAGDAAALGAPQHSDASAVESVEDGRGPAAEGSGAAGAEDSGAAGPSTQGLGQGQGLPLPLQRKTSVTLDGQTPVHGAFCEVDLYTSLHAHLLRLWQLWEMVLLGKPLLIVGLSPSDCCNATAALISLISPLSYRPDFRPYFTIHDTSFKALSSGQMPSDAQPCALPCIIGVTNPYFIKALAHWPSVLSVGQKEQSAWSSAASGAVATAAAVLNPAAAVKALTQHMRGAQSLLTARSESLWSSYRPLARPDDTLLSRLLKPQAGEVRSKLARIAVVNSEALRRHFLDLTTALLAPFSRFFEPGPEGLVPRWDAATFLSTLSGGSWQPPQILVQRFSRPADLTELYSRFIACPNFLFWMEQGQRALLHALTPEPLPVGCILGPEGKPLEEVELVGMFFESEIKLQELEAKAQASASPLQVQPEITRMKRQLASLFFGMPEDLQWTCISSPARRVMLASLQAELNSEQQQQLQRMVARLK